MRHGTTRDSGDRIINGWARAKIRSVDDTKLMQESKHGHFDQETHSGIETVHQYGFTSVVQDEDQSQGGEQPKGAEGFDIFANGNRSNGIIVAMGDRRFRLGKLQKGEVALHDDQSQQIHIARDGTYHSVPNDKSASTRVMRDGDKVKETKGGQTAWKAKKPYAYHNIDKTKREVRHPKTVQHQVTEEPQKDKNPKVIHQHVIDQDKGILASVNKLLHSITLNKLKGIVLQAGKSKHSITLDPEKGILNQTEASHSTNAKQNIIATAMSIIHNGLTSLNGDTSVTGNQTVS